MTSSATGRLLTLDAMRGIAALLVVIYHVGSAAPGLAPSGYLAVDFFFALSGLVIARTYDARLANGMGVFDFIERRAIRLYPLYGVGLLLALAAAMARIVTHAPAADPASLVVEQAALETFMLPAPSVDGSSFPLNGPGWSLFFEMAANIAYGFAALALGRRGLAALVLVAAIGLAHAGFVRGNLDVGGDWITMAGGVFRLAFSFSVGVLIQRSGLLRSRGSSWMALIPAILLIAALEAAPTGPARVPYDLAFALVISPALLMLGARYEPPAALVAPARLLGEASYPVYAIHYPLIFAAGLVAKALDVPAIVWIPAFVIGVFVAALAVSRLFDQPVRAWITRWRHPRAA